MISATYMATTTIPSVVYGVFDTVKKIMKAKIFTALKVWNSDEMGFPTDDGQCKVIALSCKKPIGEGERI